MSANGHHGTLMGGCVGGDDFGHSRRLVEVDVPGARDRDEAARGPVRGGTMCCLPRWTSRGVECA
jgi:hypothetical protein